MGFIKINEKIINTNKIVLIESEGLVLSNDEFVSTNINFEYIDNDNNIVVEKLELIEDCFVGTELDCAACKKYNETCSFSKCVLAKEFKKRTINKLRLCKYKVLKAIIKELNVIDIDELKNI